MTVFNRREQTLACLDNCYRQFDSMRGDGKYTFSIWLVDDGSTDGTSEAVRERYPQVHLIRGNGSLFWNQGMRLAWSSAEESKPDFYLWLNDDTLLKEGAIASLMETSEFLKHRSIVVGTTSNAKGELSYGGRTKSNKIVVPDAEIPVPCYTFNGNIVLIPSSVHHVLGNLEERYHHSFGDYDYGVRAAKKGITRAVAAGVLGVCDRNPGTPKWRNAAYPLDERIKYLLGPKGRPPREQFCYDCRDKGVFWAVGHAISILFKVLFPKR